MSENLEKRHQKEYMSVLHKEIDSDEFLDKEPGTTHKIAQPTLEIPDIGTPSPAVAGGDAEIPSPPPATGAGVPQPPGVPPIPTPPTDVMPEPKKETSNEEILRMIGDIKNQLDSTRNELNLSIMKDELLQEIENKYKQLEQELNSIKDRKMPEQKFFDTEGAFRDTLYNMATRMLDEFLPELFEEIPNYDFTATQVSRTFEDGTVADAIIVLRATVPKEGMKYEFKIEIPVLNGLMQYPMYIQRGQKIIPLTKPEIQRELDSMSYRKMDVQTPYEKENIFNNIGENIHRRPDRQKWYEVSPNEYKPVAMPPGSKFHTQRGKSQ